MNNGQMIDELCEYRNVSKREVAEKVGMNYQNFCQKNQRSTMRADEFAAVLDALGLEAVFRDKRTGERVVWPSEEKAEHTHNFRAMDGGVYYNTKLSYIISRNFEKGKLADAPGTPSELYVDKKGRYFLAEFLEPRNKVRALTDEEAKEYIEANGRIFK